VEELFAMDVLKVNVSIAALSVVDLHISLKIVDSK
jgi:hypothetical protein